MSATHLSSRECSPPMAVPAHGRKAAEHPLGSTSESGSLSSSGSDHLSLGDSPTSTLHETLRRGPNSSKLASAEQISTEITFALKHIKSCAPSDRLAIWREQFQISKQLAFSDSEDFHRTAISELIAHIGHIDEQLSEPEARQLFKDAALGGKWDTDLALQTAVHNELNSLGTIEKKSYIRNFMPVIRFALLKQQHLLLAPLYAATHEMDREGTLAFDETKETRLDPHDPRISGARRTMMFNVSDSKDVMTLLLFGLNLFPTHQWRRQVLGEWQPYPQRPAVSSYIMSCHHTLSNDHY